MRLFLFWVMVFFYVVVLGFYYLVIKIGDEKNLGIEVNVWV